MQPVVWTALLIGTALAGGKRFDSYLPVPVVKDASGQLILDHAKKQLTGDARTVAGKTPAAVTTLEAGLPHARKVSEHTILAAAEDQGWYHYATAVARDENGNPSVFISGYSIKKGGTEIVRWSVW